VTGKAYTPRVLTLIKELSGGKSLEANVALIKHNAAVAAQIAVEIAG
jgi:pseudouridine-5'-phosphate glycosidase